MKKSAKLAQSCRQHKIQNYGSQASNCLWRPGRHGIQLQTKRCFVCARSTIHRMADMAFEYAIYGAIIAVYSCTSRHTMLSSCDLARRCYTTYIYSSASLRGLSFTVISASSPSFKAR